jgi:hypothetical protein
MISATTGKVKGGDGKKGQKGKKPANGSNNNHNDGDDDDDDDDDDGGATKAALSTVPPYLYLLHPHDARLRDIPVPVAAPTTAETARLHAVLARVATSDAADGDSESDSDVNDDGGDDDDDDKEDDNGETAEEAAARARLRAEIATEAAEITAVAASGDLYQQRIRPLAVRACMLAGSYARKAKALRAVARACLLHRTAHARTPADAAALADAARTLTISAPVPAGADMGADADAAAVGIAGLTLSAPASAPPVAISAADAEEAVRVAEVYVAMQEAQDADAAAAAADADADGDGDDGYDPAALPVSGVARLPLCYRRRPLLAALVLASDSLAAVVAGADVVDAEADVGTSLGAPLVQRELSSRLSSGGGVEGHDTALDALCTRLDHSYAEGVRVTATEAAPSAESETEAEAAVAEGVIAAADPASAVTPFKPTRWDLPSDDDDDDDDEDDNAAGRGRRRRNKAANRASSAAAAAVAAAPASAQMSPAALDAAVRVHPLPASVPAFIEEFTDPTHWQLLRVLTHPLLFGEDVSEPVSALARRTPLHLACLSDAPAAVLCSLLAAGADPTAVDAHGQTPAALAKDPAAKHALRLYAGRVGSEVKPPAQAAGKGKSKPRAQQQQAAEQSKPLYETFGPLVRFVSLDWRRAAGVEPLDEARLRRKQAQEQQERARQRQEAAAAARVRRENTEKKAIAAAAADAAAHEERVAADAVWIAEQEREASVKAAQRAQEEKVKGMSERELRAEAMRRRLALQNPALAHKVERCASCQQPIVTIPFERLDYKYCSTECLRAHKEIVG